MLEVVWIISQHFLQIAKFDATVQSPGLLYDMLLIEIGLHGTERSLQTVASVTDSITFNCIDVLHGHFERI